MSVVAKDVQVNSVIDLDGPQGNAFVLLGIAGQTMIKSGFDKRMQDIILNEMRSRDYINLLKTFEKYFAICRDCKFGISCIDKKYAVVLRYNSFTVYSNRILAEKS